MTLLPTRTPLISLDHVFAGYDRKTILEDVTFTVQQKEFLGIIGPNGGGKTTLLKVLLGLIEPARGEVRMFGKLPKEAREKVGYVPQYTHFYRDFPIQVWDVVLMGRLGSQKWFRHYSKEDRTLAEEALASVAMQDSRQDQIGSLSEGQKQRVFIARALAKQPEVLLLDEPTASVDHPMQTSLYELLRELSRKITVILVSHDLGVIPTYVDTIACLNRKLFYHGKGSEALEKIGEAYHCPIDIIGHGHAPHRVLKDHSQKTTRPKGD